MQKTATLKTKQMLQPFQEDTRREVIWLIRIRVSYERPEELQEVLTRLGTGDGCVKLPRRQRAGRFRRAYIDLGVLPGKNKSCTQRDRMV